MRARTLSEGGVFRSGAFSATGSSGAEMFDGFILLTSTGKSYVFGAYCRDATLTKDGPSGMDIGETTNGLKNDNDSLAKR